MAFSEILGVVTTVERGGVPELVEVSLPSIAVGGSQNLLGTGIVGLLGLCLFGLLGLATEDRSSKAIRQVADSVERLRAGEYDLEFPTERDDDLGRLAEELEELTEQLRENGGKQECQPEYTNEILDVLDDVVYFLDSDGRLTSWNRRLADVTGYSDEEIEAMDATDFFAEAQQQTVSDAIEKVFETGRERIEVPMQSSDGERLPYEFVANRVESRDGAPMLAGIGRDISERKRHEQALEERERERSTLLNNIPGMVYRCKNERCWPFEFVSDGCVELTGYESDSLESGAVNWSEEIIVDRQDEIWEGVQEAVENKEPFQFTFQITTADGETRWVWEQGRGVYDDEGTLEALEGVIFDITEQKSTQQQFERTQKMLAQSQRLAKVGAWEYDATEDSETTWWSDEVYRIHDIEPDCETRLEDEIEFYHPEDRPMVEDAFYAALDGEPYELEVRLITATGEQKWVRTQGQPVTQNGAVTGVRGSIQDITEHKERERELERTKLLLEETQHLANVGGWELDLTEEPYEGIFTDETYRIHGLPVGTEMDMQEGLSYYHPSEQDRIQEVVTRAIETGESYDIEAKFVTAEDDERWVQTTGVPVYEDGDIVRLHGALQDITERKERERALESLQGTAQALLGANSFEDVADLVVEAAESILDIPGVAVYLLDDETNRLEPTAFTPAFAALSGNPDALAIDERDSILWRAFVAGTQMTIEGSDDDHSFNSQVEGGLAVPMGDHGVFVLATPAEVVSDETRRLVETLVVTTEAAFDRVENEAALQDRESELATRNRRLGRQIQINQIIRSVHESLIGANSREEIERTVCERLVEAENVAFAWIGVPEDGKLVPETWAGGGQEYLDQVNLPLESGTEPATVAAATGAPTVVSNVVEALGDEDWRENALLQEFNSVVSVPITFEDYSFGVLTVYADEPGIFTELERDVFTELGESIANSLIATQTRRALHADTLVELTLRVSGDSFFTRVAADADCTIEYSGLVSHSTDETRLFFTTRGAEPDQILSVLDDLVAVTDTRLVSQLDGECLFEATVTGTVLASWLVEHGASPRSIRVVEDELEVVVDVPTTADIREFVEMLEATYVDTELLSRRDVERSMQTRQEFLTSLLEDLTDRQLEVLKTAYFAGFFEWPRTSTGEDIAEMFDVTQPTINRHIRLGQQRLLAELFEDAVTGTE